MDAPFSLKQLDDSEFDFFRSIVYKETGIRLSDLKKSLLQSRLLRRMRELKMHQYSGYADYLKDNYDDEILNFINAVTTNKTEFFRENQHFEYLKETLLPQFINAGKKKLRFWSAGCSTGEEPYTLAMTLREHFATVPFPDIKILATDIDTQVLQKGIDGVYKSELVSDIDMNLLKKYFARGTGERQGLFKVKNCLSDLITFKRLNLLDSVYPMKGRFNVIFCRNVVIYFDKPTQKALFDRFHEYLEDDGFLFVGHSENLSGLTDKFRLVGKTIYRKS
jgi:chemotaxis protein methyltransferase CheR